MTVTDIFEEQDDPTEGGLIINGRYRIVPVDGGKPKARTRITNFARVLEDTFALTSWQQRMVAVGLTHREDLRIQVAACSLDEKKELNELCEKAKDEARANAKRDTGSALHKLAERVDRGESFPIPAPWDADIAAYQAVLAATGVVILPEYIEGVVEVPELELAGRFDRLVDYEGRLTVADLKTGNDLSYSWGSIAVQLRLYAGASTIYDPVAKTHVPMPPVDQTRALVFHLPSESGTCTVYELDLALGEVGIDLITKVKQWRKDVKSCATIIPALAEDGGEARDEEQEVCAPAPQPLREHVVARIQAIKNHGSAALLAKRWPEGVPTLKASDTHSEADLDLILAACVQAEAEAQMPFCGLKDPRLPVDEGPMAERQMVEATKARFEALESDLQAEIAVIVRQALDAGTPINVSTMPSLRRVHIAESLVLLASQAIPSTSSTEQVVRACLVPVLGDLQEAITTGAYLGSLGVADAALLLHIAQAIETRDGGAYLLAWDEDRPTLIGTAA